MNSISCLTLFLLFDSTCGLHVEKLKQLGAEADEYESKSGTIPPILFLKTHKTGGSTIVNILHRLGDSQDMKFMLPQGGCTLGWPSTFPSGSKSIFDSPAHQYDIICNHAVYNRKIMLAYMKETPRPFVFTILRDPISHLKSAFNWWYTDDAADHTQMKELPEESAKKKRDNHEDVWAHAIKVLKQMETHPHEFREGTRAHLLNGQSHDLGWFESNHGKRASHDDIQKWVENLGFDFVMISDMFDESLVRLKEELGLTLEEVSNVHLKGDHEDAFHGEPTAEQYKELQDLLHVDFSLHHYYKQKFLKEWERHDRSEDVDKLRKLNKYFSDVCTQNSTGECPWGMAANNHKWTDYLEHKQKSAVSYTSTFPPLRR